MAEAARIGPWGGDLNRAGDKFGVAVHTKLFFIRADILLFLGDTDTHSHFEDCLLYTSTLPTICSV